MTPRTFTVGAVMLTWGVAFAEARERESEKPAVLWSEPSRISARDLFYGQGGAKHAPEDGPFTFVAEELDGKSPKFVVQDRNGVRWKVKVGAEARPETVVTRFIWAVGYATDEDYLVPMQKVRGMPKKLKRGAEHVSADGTVRNGRWERMDNYKLGSWSWLNNPFLKTRELNGLRVLMALFNNWDVNSSQNSIYQVSGARQYLVTDLGATLGRNGPSWPVYTVRGDVEVYRRSGFIDSVSKDHVTFVTPSWPKLFRVVPIPPLPYSVFAAPFAFMGIPPAVDPTSTRPVGRRIPRQDVLWMAGLLKQLSPAQIRSAFRAAHYSPEEVEAFSRIVEGRIAELNRLAENDA